MIAIRAAREIVRRRSRPVKGTERVMLDRALGRVLAEPVRADREDPPFARAMMDGFALRASDTAQAPCKLVLTGRVAAGDDQLPVVEPGCAVRINTGAPLPPGADAVIPLERTRGEVVILGRVEAGSCIQARGSLARAGEVVAEGCLTPEKVAVCAAMGADPAPVRRRPRVAVLATGTELHPAPGTHQIRNSNGPMLLALLRGAEPCEILDLGSVADDREALDRAVARGLEADLLLTTGGVSKGDLDYVGPALRAAGVEILFHGVALQPGKPVLFGARGSGLVLGLPGNPVSSLVCADLFALPCLAALAGRDFEALPARRRALLEAPVKASGRRERIFPCRLEGERATPLPWRSSADLFTAARGNAYLVIPSGVDLARGEVVTCLVPERSGRA